MTYGDTGTNEPHVPDEAGHVVRQTAPHVHQVLPQGGRLKGAQAESLRPLVEAVCDDSMRQS